MIYRISVIILKLINKVIIKILKKDNYKNKIVVKIYQVICQ